MTHTPELSVVMPAYRLGDVIEANIAAVVEALSGLDTEIIVIDDGSDDDTGERAEAGASRFDHVRVVHHEVNRGKGEALTTGTAAATGSIVCFLDADLDLPPDQVPAMVELLDGADVIAGAKRSTMAHGAYPALRRILSRVFAFATTGIFGLPIRETQTGLKVFRREVLDEVLPRVRLRGYAFDLELLVRAHRAGYRIAETPVRLGPTASEAPLRAKMLWELGRDTIRLAWWLITRR